MASSVDSGSGGGEGASQIIYVPRDAWQDVVEYYSTALDQEPNPAEPPEAVFQLPNATQLRVIGTDDEEKLALRPVNFSLHVRTAGKVEAAYRKALTQGAQSVIEPQELIIFPVSGACADAANQVRLTLASVRFSSKTFVTLDLTLGVAHNPNW